MEKIVSMPWNDLRIKLIGAIESSTKQHQCVLCTSPARALALAAGHNWIDSLEWATQRNTHKGAKQGNGRTLTAPSIQPISLWPTNSNSRFKEWLSHGLAPSSKSKTKSTNSKPVKCSRVNPCPPRPIRQMEMPSKWASASAPIFSPIPVIWSSKDRLCYKPKQAKAFPPKQCFLVFLW